MTILTRDRESSLSLTIPRKNICNYIVSFDILQIKGMNKLYLNHNVGDTLYLECITKDEGGEKKIKMDLLSSYSQWKYNKFSNQWSVEIDKQLEFEADFTKWGRTYKRRIYELVLHNQVNLICCKKC